MTNVRQVNQIYRPILNNHLAIKPAGNRFICITPVYHLACGIFIERTSHRDYCGPWWTVMALFLPQINRNIFLGTYRENLFRPQSSSERSWLWSDPTMIADAIEVIETVALPKLQVYGTLEGYATLPRREHWVHYEPLEDRMLVHIAAGDFETARTIFHEQEPKYRGQTYHPDSLLHRWQMQLDTVREPLLDDDRPALARILHGWEAANVQGTSIERYWEPTPFPFERGPG